MQYFYGEDTYAAREAVRDFVKEKNATIRWIDREDLEDKSLADWIDQGSSGLFGREIVVVRDPSSLPKSLQEIVVDEAGKDALVWDRVVPDKRSKLFKALKASATEFVQDERSVVAWLMQQGDVNSAQDGSSVLPADRSVTVAATAQGQSVSSGIDMAVAQELVRRVGLNKWQLLSTLEVLMLTRDKVELSDVEEHVPMQAQGEMFSMLDALSAGDVKRGVEIMEQLLESGESEFYIFSMLVYQCKTLFMIRSGNTKGVHPYVVQKNTQVAQRFSEAQLLNALTKVVATDFAIKQGKVDARTALTMLVAGLFV